jgi:F-type H+-transporting ATPase subunit b
MGISEMIADTSNFLIPNGTLIVEIVAFLIVLYFIGRRVLPWVNKQIEARQELIRESLEAAEKAREEADETRSERETILEDARQQAREMVSVANRTADQARADGQVRGQQEYERLVASAEAEIALARQRALDELTSRIGALVLSVARQVIEREIDAQRHRALIDEAVSAIRAEATSATGSFAPLSGTDGAPDAPSAS